MKESIFQAKVIRRLKEVFPGCVVLKNDPLYTQGVPDLLVLWREHWFALEVKKSRDAPLQPNQKYYVKTMAAMSYCVFIFPENEEDVFNELQRTFSTRG